MPFFSKVFKSKDAPASKAGQNPERVESGSSIPLRAPWQDSWSRTEVSPNEVQELIHVCTQELKSRATDMPFVILPFRPIPQSGDCRNFIRSYFKSHYEGHDAFRGAGLQNDLRLTEPLALCSIIKWCWSRLPGGVVTWDVYELFKAGEKESRMAQHAFDTLIPLTVDSDARRQIIFDFFEVLAAIAARAKANGLGGRKLSRLAGWWAFAHSDNGKGFEGGYESWISAADATSHLFFAYLRSRTPDPVHGLTGINTLPRSLEALLSQTEYPPQAPSLMFNTTTKVVMIVSSVSPTPFALLRRAKQFEYRDDDEALQQFSTYDDPVQMLTDECRRVLNCISSINHLETSASGSVLKPSDPLWSQFEDLGFDKFSNGDGNYNRLRKGPTDDLQSIRSTARSRTDAQGRPTTPSWADFLTTGFANDASPSNSGNYLLPPDKSIPPLGDRSVSSQSFRRSEEDALEPGELASITRLDLDETFWWVWMMSLAGEEPTERKKVFGRCAVVETGIAGSRWLVMEEQVKGASPGQDEGAYIVEKKGRFSFTRRGKLGRRKTSTKTVNESNQLPTVDQNVGMPPRKASISPEQQVKVQAAAVQLAHSEKEAQNPRRRSRTDESVSQRTNSILSLQPVLMTEAGPAMKWIKEFDKDALRAKYLGDPTAGKGSAVDLSTSPNEAPSGYREYISGRELPRVPQEPEDGLSRRDSPLPATPKDEALPIPRKHVALNATAAEAFEEKTQPILDNHEQHPAYRKSPPKEPSSTGTGPVAAAREVLENRETAPTSPPVPAKQITPPKKLYKQQPTKIGFKKLFGRRQSETNTQVAPPAPQIAPELSHEDTSRQESSISDEPESFKQHSFHEDEQAAAPAPAPVMMPSEQHRADLTPEPLSEVDSSPQISRVNTNDQRDPQSDLSRLDQGPLQDVPAFVPDSSGSEISETPPARKPEQPLRNIEQPMPIQIKKEKVDKRPKVIIPEVKEEEEKKEEKEEKEEEQQYSGPVQDRWAQIRKNAAERSNNRNATINSAHGGGDISGQGSRTRDSQSSRVDEGYTSEEETIESRVARIKARVAELTGNGDVQAPGLTQSR